MRSFLRCGLLAGVLLTVFACAIPSNAAADPFEMNPCGTYGAGNNIGSRDWAGAGSDQYSWIVEDECQGVATFRQQAPSTNYLPHAQSYLELGPGTITGATLVLLGVDGIDRGFDLGVAICGDAGWPSNCSALARVEAGDPVDGREVTFETGDIPAGATRLVMIADCLLEFCPVGAGIQIENVHVTLEDPTPPTATLTESFWSGSGPWHGSSAGLNATGYDPESGVAELTLFRNGIPIWRHVGCDWRTPVDSWICSIFEGYEPDVWVPKLSQGENALTLEVKNGAGMASYRTLLLMVDSNPPHFPRTLDLGSTPQGWVLGTRIIARWINSPESAETEYSSGVHRAHVDVDPVPGGPGIGDPPPFTADGDGITTVPIELPDYGEWRISIATEDRAGNISDPTVERVKSDSGSTGALALNPVPAITLAHVSTGVQLSWPAVTGAAPGICGYRTAIDDQDTADLGDVGFVPAPNVTTNLWSLSAAGLRSVSDGLRYLHVQAVSCSGGVSNTDSTELIVDRQLPTVTAQPAGGWLTLDPTVLLDAEDLPSELPDPTIQYQLDTDPIVETTAATAAVTIPSGQHDLKFRAIDSVGQVSQWKQITVGSDLSAPDATVSNPDRSAPAHFEATVEDTESGLVDAWVELVRSGESSGVGVGDRFESNPGSKIAQKLSFEIPDDGSLPDGEYFLRVVARDAAGHVSSTSVFADGAAAKVSLPIRPRPRLSAGLAEAPGKPANESKTFAFGSKAELRGTLTAASGAPVAAAPIRVIAERVGEGTRRVVATATTDGNGNYSLRLTPDVSRKLTVRYAGSTDLGPATAVADQAFRSGVSVRLSRKTVRSGAAVHFRGRVNLLTASVPPRGKRIEIELCPRGRCKSLGFTTRTRSDGSFSFRIPTSGIRRSTKFTYRARVPAEGGWPFADGVSRRVTLEVRAR